MTTLFSALYNCKDPFNVFSSTIGCVSPNQMHSDGVLLLHGGEDISPSIYGEKANSKCFASNKVSKRDKKEIEFVNRAVQLNIPIIGICRGAQLLCALAGGKVIQDVTGHDWGKHDLETEDGEYQMTNSIHHQMMHLEGTKHKLIAWATPRRSTHYLGESNKAMDISVEPEMVCFPELRALAVQGHPEYLHHDNPFVKFTLRKAKQYVL